MKYTYTIDVPEGWTNESTVEGLLEPSMVDVDIFEEWSGMDLLDFHTEDRKVHVSVGWIGSVGEVGTMDDGCYVAVVLCDGADHDQWNGTVREMCSRSSYEIKKFVEQALKDYK